MLGNDQLRRLFETAAMTMAVIHMEMDEVPAQTVTASIREHVSDLLRRPGALLTTVETTIERCQNLPPEEDRTAELLQ